MTDKSGRRYKRRAVTTSQASSQSKFVMSTTTIFSSMDKEQHTDKKHSIRGGSEKEKTTTNPGTSPDFKKGSFFDDLEDVGLFKWDYTSSRETSNKSQVSVSDR